MVDAQGNESDAQAIRRIVKPEEQKAVFARLRGIMKPRKAGALSHIIAEDSEGNLRTVHNQSEINKMLLARNTKRFSQADGTLFTVSPIATLMGRYGTNVYRRQILDVKIDTETIATTEAAQTIL